MTSPSPDSDDLALLIEAARAAGALLKRHFGTSVRTWSKGAQGPVTEVDLAADALLKSMLRDARPEYGWLSEETADTPERLDSERCFVIDPLDGTVAFIKGKPDFCVSAAVVANGAPVAGVVFNPMRDELYAARAGAGAHLNDAAIQASAQAAVSGARLIGSASFYADPRWPAPWPELTATSVPALAYRLALVAAGSHDGVVSLGFKHEWDLAAGAVLVGEAGGIVTDPFGQPFRFNQPVPRLPGAVAAGPALHPLLIERVRGTPHPSVFQRSGD